MKYIHCTAIASLVLASATAIGKAPQSQAFGLERFLERGFDRVVTGLSGVKEANSIRDKIGEGAIAAVALGAAGLAVFGEASNSGSKEKSDGVDLSPPTMIDVEAPEAFDDGGGLTEDGRTMVKGFFSGYTLDPEQDAKSFLLAEDNRGQCYFRWKWFGLSKGGKKIELAIEYIDFDLSRQDGSWPEFGSEEFKTQYLQKFRAFLDNLNEREKVDLTRAVIPVAKIPGSRPLKWL